jgi:hypothetical protein
LSVDQWNKKTIVTFSHPVEVAGNMVLPAGKYVFKLAEFSSSRHFVQIWNEDETKLLTTLIAIPNYRLEPTGKRSLSSMSGLELNHRPFGHGSIRAIPSDMSSHIRKSVPCSRLERRMKLFQRKWQTTFEAVTELVVLPLNVTDANGDFVSLAVENFRVHEDGRLQKIRLFEREDMPVTVGLIVDHSRSMEGSIRCANHPSC